MDIKLSDPIFNNEDAARTHFEKLRWPDGTVCPHCGVIGNSIEMKGKSTRKGLYKCRDCRKPFTATIGTLYERSHIPLHKWLLATHLLCASKKGMSAHQLYRMLGFGSYRTAWFMAHRIREAMAPEGNLPPLGGKDKIVEVDETFIGNHGNKPKGQGGYKHKYKVLSLVERGGNVRSFHVDSVKAKTLKPIVMAHVKTDTRLMTDEASQYKPIGREFVSHESVMHSADEYARGDVYTNTIEGFFSIFKRGMKGTYQHCGEQHLKRYLAEFDFRYNGREITDGERAELAIKRVEGKRLRYQDPRKKAA